MASEPFHPDETPRSEDDEVRVSKARIQAVVNVLSVMAIGGYDPQTMRLPPRESDAFGLLEEGFNLFAREHAETTQRNLEYLRTIEQARQEAAERQVREAQLQEQLMRAQLHTLRMQLQPHFLFNTLNSIAALVEEDVRAGQQMIAHLSDFFRLTLESTRQQEVTLRDELTLIGHYLDLEKMRFGDRLQVSLDVAPEALDALVPSFILQPLVENAIRHGIQPAIEGGTVQVVGRVEGERVHLEVRDDGVGLAAPASAGARLGPARRSTGVGLSNTRQRLAQRFGEPPEQLLEVRARTPRGTCVTLRFPRLLAARGDRRTS
ncbi:hypothetical protein FGE12_06210 [Aggregicoccus sp. 17bor-14]|uniref:sensor histidine kinase n=1 Tax=Myxococcaceae TaxID=31 RepID=UPI00129C24E2|nr:MULTISPECIES: histidine kinase [Myxococcaceae]MBF5041980.1 histidine kinase [Simulacricoccus sp. 17bor-14]MRI87760.1 hypothetical protein [Aggregicoccus sp. 17bor-14]